MEVRETASAAVAVLVRICGEHLALKLASDFKEWAQHEIPASKVPVSEKSGYRVRKQCEDTETIQHKCTRTLTFEICCFAKAASHAAPRFVSTSREQERFHTTQARACIEAAEEGGAGAREQGGVGGGEGRGSDELGLEREKERVKQEQERVKQEQERVKQDKLALKAAIQRRYVCVCVYMHTHTHTHTHTHACAQVCHGTTGMRVCPCIHTYIHACGFQYRYVSKETLYRMQARGALSLAALVGA